MALRCHGHVRQSRTKPPQCCRSELLIVRHGEKVNDETVGLSAVGMQRAQYLARCLQHRSAARSLGGVATLIAPTIRAGKSERMVDTLRPIADQLHLEIDSTVDKADPAAFVALIQRSGTVRLRFLRRAVRGLTP